jgi:hypothetical protein
VGSIEARGHAFVIRIWLERAGEEESWRGYITHATTEERHHFRELNEIGAFIRRYVERGGENQKEPGQAGR